MQMQTTDRLQSLISFAVVGLIVALYAVFWLGVGVLGYYLGAVPALICALASQAALFLFCRVPLGYNLRSLLVRWRVTAMTSLAFTLVVALLVVMLAFVKGMYRLTETSGQPGNVIVLADGATDELFSNLGRGDITALPYHTDAVSRVSRLTRNGKEEPLASWEVYIVVNQPVPTPPGERPRRRFIQVRGIDDPLVSGAVHGLELYPGGNWFGDSGLQKYPSQGDTAPDAIQGVLGEGIARDLGRDHGKERLEVGDLFELGGRQWIVAGIMKSLGSTFGSEVWAKRSLVGPIFGKESYTSLVLRTPDAKTAKQLAELLTTNFKNPAVKAQAEDEYYKKLSDTNQQFLYAIVFVAAIMSVGGVFGVMNTMFAAISQRTRDIGVLRIIGFKPWQVLASFFMESLWIAVAGGVVGCALGFLADGYTASSIVSGGQGGGGKSVVFKLTVDTQIVAVGLIFTLAMGGIGGLLPALSAMRLKPLDAMR